MWYGKAATRSAARWLANNGNVAAQERFALGVPGDERKGWQVVYRLAGGRNGEVDAVL
jgi:hypothetical protein